MKTRSWLLLGLAGFSACVLASAPTGLASDSRRPDLPVRYSTAHVESAPGAKVEVEAETSLDPVTFALNSFEGKYRIVRVEVENRTAARIKLNAESDRFVAKFGKDKVVTGILDLSAADGKSWDTIDMERRKRLAYPNSLEGKASLAIYVFFPRDQLPDLPGSFEWVVAKGDKTFTLAQPLQAKK